MGVCACVRVKYVFNRIMCYVIFFLASGIPPDSTESTKKIPGPSAYDRYSTNNDLVIVGTVLGLFTTICVSSVLFIVIRKSKIEFELFCTDTSQNDANAFINKIHLGIDI